MNRWEDLIGANRARRLAAILCEAAAIAHRENGLRFDADDLGDDALIYGLCTTINARHVAATMVEAATDLDGVTVREKGRVWWLEVERDDQVAVRVYFYKAPPEATRLDSLNLKDSEIKKELSASNGSQLALFTSSGQPGHPTLLNLVVVHYGDPVDGMTQVDAGAPYVIAGDVAWEWGECLYRATDEQSAHQDIDRLGDDDEGFDGLRLVETEPADQASADPPAPVEPATTEFDALELRADDDENAAGGGREPG